MSNFKDTQYDGDGIEIDPIFYNNDKDMDLLVVDNLDRELSSFPEVIIENPNPTVEDSKHQKNTEYFFRLQPFGRNRDERNSHLYEAAVNFSGFNNLLDKYRYNQVAPKVSSLSRVANELIYIQNNKDIKLYGRLMSLPIGGVYSDELGVVVLHAAVDREENYPKKDEPLKKDKFGYDFILTRLDKNNNIGVAGFTIFPSLREKTIKSEGDVGDFTLIRTFNQNLPEEKQRIVLKKGDKMIRKHIQNYLQDRDPKHIFDAYRLIMLSENITSVSKKSKR